MLRECIKSGSELGLQAKSRMDKGELVPDSLVIEMVLERIRKADAKNGFLMDGFPRTPEQARGFSDALGLEGRSVRLVLYLRTSNEMAIQRIQGRRVCERCGRIFHIVNLPPKPGGKCDLCGGSVLQRKDDLPETVLHRLEVYERQTAPLVEYYQKLGIIREVDCDRSFPETHQELERLFRELIPGAR
jgi:adenylate kinase